MSTRQKWYGIAELYERILGDSESRAAGEAGKVGFSPGKGITEGYETLLKNRWLYKTRNNKMESEI